MEYFCEDCGCAACSHCAVLDPNHRGHAIIPLNEASQQQSRSLENLIRRVRDVNEKYVTAVQCMQQLKQDLDQVADSKIKAIDEVMTEFLQHVEKVGEAFKQDIQDKKDKKTITIREAEGKLQEDLARMLNSEELATNVVKSGSDSNIISLYPALSSALQQLAESQPPAVDSNLSVIEAEPPHGHTRVDLPSLEQLLCDKLNIAMPSKEPHQGGNQAINLSPKEPQGIGNPLSLSPAISLSTVTTSVPRRPEDMPPVPAISAGEAAVPTEICYPYILFPKQEISGDDLCGNHSMKNEYFCKDCSCAACSDCGLLDPSHRGHTFIRLNEASQQQSKSLENLTMKVKDVEVKYVAAVQHAQQVKQSLDRAVDSRIQAIDEAEKEFSQQVQNVIGASKQDIYHKKEENAIAIEQTETRLQEELANVRKSCELATNVVQSSSDSDIISLYPALSSTLQKLAESQTSAVDSNLGEIQLEPPQGQTRVNIPSLEQLLCDKLNITMPPSESVHVGLQTTMLHNVHVGTQTTSHLSDETSSVRNILPPSSEICPLKTGTNSLSTKPGNMSPGAKISEYEAAAAIEEYEAVAPVPQHNTAEGSEQHAINRASTPKASRDVSRFSFFSRFRTVPTVKLKEWEECGHITINSTLTPSGIAIHPSGDVAVTSDFSPVTVFSVNDDFKDFKHVIEGSPSRIHDIAITPTNQYIIPGKKGNNEFYIYDSHFTRLNTIPTYDINKTPTRPRSVAVDSTGRIIVGLGCDNHKTVSIHQTDGTLISQFETASSPRKLTATPDDRLIISFDDKTLQVMDQSGHNARIIKPPPGIQSWQPWYPCCSKQGELFVVNRALRNGGVHRYMLTDGKYKYKDCITKVDYPCGIALSADENNFYMVYLTHAVKIFK